jgi:flagellar export protein FliJ
MKSFHFPLEVVLEARRAQEARAAQQLALALEKQLEATTRSREAMRGLNLLLAEITNGCSGRFSVADRDRSWALREVQQKLCDELRIAVQECIRLTEEKRGVVVQMRRNRKLIEHLKEARYAAWQKEAERAEQHQFDEFAMTRCHQSSQQEHALC